MRVPCLVRWPKRVPAGTVCDELGTMMDLLPTFAFLAGATPPGPNVIDGRNIWPLFAGEKDARTPHEALYYYQFEQLQAVRSGPWKLFLPLTKQRISSSGPLKDVKLPARLYNVVSDQSESKDVAAQQPEVVARLTVLAQRGRDRIGDVDAPGSEDRPAGWVFQPQMQRLPAKR